MSRDLLDKTTEFLVQSYPPWAFLSIHFHSLFSRDKCKTFTSSNWLGHSLSPIPIHDPGPLFTFLDRLLLEWPKSLPIYSEYLTETWRKRFRIIRNVSRANGRPLYFYINILDLNYSIRMSIYVRILKSEATGVENKFQPMRKTKNSEKNMIENFNDKKNLIFLKMQLRLGKKNFAFMHSSPFCTWVLQLKFKCRNVKRKCNRHLPNVIFPEKFVASTPAWKNLRRSKLTST